MKKLYIYFIGLGLLITSCNDSFLEKDPLDQVTDISLTYTADECRLYVNEYYMSFWGAPTSYSFHDDKGSDNLLSFKYDDNIDLIKDLRTVPTYSKDWTVAPWEKIRSVNFLLDNYHKSKEIEKAEKFVAEARFFRAFYYFEQFLKKFGGVPWIDKQLTVDSEELYAPRLERNELVDNILEDLDWAISKLPSHDSQTRGRISKEVALLYKARIALYEGTWEKYHANTPFAGKGDVTNYIKAARDAAKAVIDSRLFDIDNVGVEDGYHILFNQHSYANSKEVMLWKEFDRSLGLWHGNNREEARSGSGVGLTRWLVDSYLVMDTDGKARPISLASNYQGDDNLLKVIANRDPRLTQTMYAPGRVRTVENQKDTLLIFTKSNINYADAEKCSTGYELAKGVDPDGAEQVAITGSIKGSIIFRYAEALLIYAEARAELDEITQDDLNITVNKLRDRVGMPHLTVDPGYVDPKGEFTAARGYQGVPVSNILQEIRRERRIEFACEGYRHDDLKRWRAHHLWNHDKIQGAKTAQFENLTWLIDFFKTYPVPKSISGGYDEFMNKTVPQWIPQIEEGVNYFTDEEGYMAPYQKFLPDGHFQFDPNKSYLIPIPTEQLILNKNLVQNPGWE